MSSSSIFQSNSISCRSTFPHPLEIDQLLARQLIQIGDIMDEVFAEQLGDDALAETIYIHRIPGNKMDQAFLI